MSKTTEQLPPQPMMRYGITLKHSNRDITSARTNRFNATAGRKPCRVSHGFNPGENQWTDYEYSSKTERDEAQADFEKQHDRGQDGLLRVETFQTTEPIPTRKRSMIRAILSSIDLNEMLFGGCDPY